MASQRIQRQVDRLLDEAEEAVAQRDWAVLRERAEHILTLDPQNAGALAFLSAAERGIEAGSSATVEAGPQLAQPETESTPNTTHLLRRRPLSGQGLPWRRGQEEGLSRP